MSQQGGPLTIRTQGNGILQRKSDTQPSLRNPVLRRNCVEVEGSDKPAIIAGHSVSAMIAVLAANRKPSRISSIISALSEAIAAMRNVLTPAQLALAKQ